MQLNTRTVQSSTPYQRFLSYRTIANTTNGPGETRRFFLT